MVIGKAGNDPRSENDKRQQKFQQTVAVVSRAHANEVPQELAYDIFDTFPDPILMYLILASDRPDRR